MSNTIFTLADSLAIPYIIWPILLTLIAIVLLCQILLNIKRLYNFAYMQQQSLREYTPLLLKTMDMLGQDTKFIETKYTTYQEHPEDADHSAKAHVTKMNE